MPIIHAIILGIVQGLSEFLPISSSGHLTVVPWLFRWHEFDNNASLEKAFDLALHVGTFVGAFAYFWKDVVRYVGAAWRTVKNRRIDGTDERVAWLLLVASVPAALLGVVFDSSISDNRRMWLIGGCLIVFGVLLGVVDQWSKGTRSADDFRWQDAALIGAAQAVSLQPGVSRSGSTITAGRLLGFDRPAAVRLSFLMALPITAGAAFYKLAKQLKGDGIPSAYRPAFVWGALVSAIVGFAAITALMKFVRTRSFTPFVIYRVLAGLLVLGVWAAR